MSSAFTPAARPASLGGDIVAAAIWVAVVVPPSFGFWLVAGDLAGVPAGEQRTLVLASLLALGVATLGQVWLGYRMAVFEGPASTYLGAVAVLAASTAGADPAEATGGLLAAGVLVVVLAAFRADRMMRRIFTPPVIIAFLLIVVVTVIPATVERAVGLGSGHSLGVAAAWVSSLVVVAVAVGGQRLGRLRPFSLLAALVLGTLCYFLLAGFPDAGALDSSWQLPEAFPWGAPVITVAVVPPFLIAGLLASFNTVASIEAMADLGGAPAPPGARRRGIAAHGGTQILTACLGNVLGNVPRLDSVGVVRMIGNARPQALGIAAAAIIALAFSGPVVELLALIPVAVSAALLAVVLATLAAQGLRQLASIERRRRWLVVAPALVPTIAWLLFSDRLSEQAQLIANPFLIGVVLAVVLDRTVSRDPCPTAKAAG